MSAATEVTQAAILKRLYPEDRIEKMMYDENPLFATLPKKYDAPGESWTRALRIAHTAGRSAVFSTAKANKQASNVVRLLITVTQDYSIYSVSGKLIALASSNKGSLVNAFEEEIDAAMDAMNRSFGWGVYGNGGGAIGQVSSATTLSSTTLKLSNVDDVIKFEVGQWLNFSTADGTSGAVEAGRVQVTAINRDDTTPTITVSTALSTAVPSIAASDYIFTEGDFGQKMKGLDAWVPLTAPAPADSFFGLDRSADAVRLAGTRLSGAGLSIAEAVKKGLQAGKRNGAKTSHIFMNDKRFFDLELELGSQKQYVDTNVGEVGFSGIEFISSGKSVMVYSDVNCPSNTIYGLQMDTWSLEGPKKFPELAAIDGTKLLREESADAYEGRVISYHQMCCKAPGRNWRVDLNV